MLRISEVICPYMTKKFFIRRLILNRIFKKFDNQKRQRRTFQENGTVNIHLIVGIIIIIIYFYYSDLFTIFHCPDYIFLLVCPLLDSMTLYPTFHFSINLNSFIICFLFLLLFPLGLHHSWKVLFNCLLNGFCASSVFSLHCIFHSASKLILHKYCFHHRCHVLWQHCNWTDLFAI